MKAKVFLLSTLALAMCGSAQAATVYKNDTSSFEIGGRLQAHYVTVRASNHDKAELQSKARLRTRGSVVIKEGIQGIEFTEWEVGSATSQNGKFNTRYAYLGFKTDKYGQLTFGQDVTAMYDVTGVSDIYTEWGNKGTTFWDLGGRQEGQIKYRIDDINKSGLSFVATYQTASLDKVDSGVTAAISYQFNDNFPIEFNVGYDRYEMTDAQQDNSSVAGSVTFGTNGDGLYFGGLYQFTDYKHKKNMNSFELFSSYTMDNGLKGILSYRNQRQDSATLLSSLLAEASYNFTPNFKVFAEGEFGIGKVYDKNGATGEKTGSKHDYGNKGLIGLQYNF